MTSHLTSESLRPIRGHLSLLQSVTSTHMRTSCSFIRNTNTHMNPSVYRLQNEFVLQQRRTYYRDMPVFKWVIYKLLKITEQTKHSSFQNQGYEILNNVNETKEANPHISVLKKCSVNDITGKDLTNIFLLFWSTSFSKIA